MHFIDSKPQEANSFFFFFSFTCKLFFFFFPLYSKGVRSSLDVYIAVTVFFYIYIYNF